MGNDAASVTANAVPQTVMEGSSPLSTTGATDISCTRDACCVVLANANLKCWGSHYSYEVGVAGDGSYATPVTLVTDTGNQKNANGDGIDTGTPILVAKLASGWSMHHMCVILTSGDTACWGHNGYGQRGADSGPNMWTPTVVPLPHNAVSIATVRYGTAAIVTTGQVYGMGWNFYGELTLVGTSINTPTLTTFV